MVVLIKAVQVIIALSILILIHEAGHFTFAKIFGIRVDKFFLFFDIGGVKLFSTRNGWFTKIFPSAKNWSTEYGIGWLPLGGYCKICGMVDESLDTEALKHEPEPWEFRSKEPWKRLLVLAGGVLNNFIFAFIAYIGIIATWGTSYISNHDSRIYTNELGNDLGFRNGDRILSMDGYEPENFGMLQADLARRKVKMVSVLRDSDTLDICIDQTKIGDVLNTPGLFDLAIPFVIDSIACTSANISAGLNRGDRIVSIDGIEVQFLQDSREVLADCAGTQVVAGVIRGSDTLAIPLQVDTSGRIGAYMRMPDIKTREYTIPEAIPAGIKHTFTTIRGYIQDLRLLATPKTKAYKSVGSFIAIGQVFPSSWNWYGFINIIALLSIMLAVMNLLPIPGLDGGHIMFTLYEMITGRKPSETFLEKAQIAGMLLLLILMFFACGNDIHRLIR